MTNYEHIINMNVEELASFFNKPNEVDRTPWDDWFEENYCKNCEPIEEEEENGRTACYAYCEIYDKCKYFADYPDFITEKDTIELWLNAECEK